MPLVTPADVKQLQADVRAEAYALADAVKRCMFDGTLPAGDPLVSQWQQMMDRVQAFLAQDPSWVHTAAQMDAGQQIQRDLQPWHAQLAARGCKDVPPSPAPPPGPQDLFGSLEKIGLLILAMMALREMH